MSEALLNYGKNYMTSDLEQKTSDSDMLKNYLKIALRNLLKYKGYSLINIGGLAIGIACCLLIALWVVYELSYDRFHANAGRIYRVAEIFREDGKIVEESAGIPFPVGPTLREAFPNLNAARFYQTFEKIPLLRHGENSFYEPRLFFTDSTVFDIFSFILLLACINFMNLATARSIKRAKEIAVRKVVGAFRTQLVGQFLGESLLISFIAAFLAAILVELLLPTFARISGANLDLALIGFPKLFAGVGLLAAIVGLIAGSYPALFLSSYLPVEGLGLKSNRGAGAITALFRKGLVVFQLRLFARAHPADGDFDSPKLVFLRRRAARARRDGHDFASIGNGLARVRAAASVRAVFLRR